MCVLALAGIDVRVSGGRPPVVAADAAISSGCHDVSGGELDQGNRLPMLLLQNGTRLQLVSR